MSAASQDVTITVTTLDDELNTDGDCSLREAIDAANTNSAVDACGSGDVLTDTITFDVAGTITLTEQLDVSAGGPLLIDSTGAITITGGGSVRIFSVDSGAELELQGLTLVNGHADYGAGIFNMGTLTITNSTLSGNTAEGNGGGVFNWSALTITDSTLSRNSANDGGGIYNRGTVNITNSTLSINNALYLGGSIFNDSILTIVNSTLSNNIAKYGGAIENLNTLTITSTIVANSPTGGDCHAGSPITDGGHNLSSDYTCGFDPANGSLPNTDPLLGPLQDNGGPTWTHALLVGSPAIDAGDDALCPPTDQRGMPRPFDGDEDGLAVCDIGSFEYYIPGNYLPLIVKD